MGAGWGMREKVGGGNDGEDGHEGIRVIVGRRNDVGLGNKGRSRDNG